MTETIFKLVLAGSWTGVPNNQYKPVPLAGLTIDDPSLMSLDPVTHQLTMHTAGKIHVEGQLWITAGMPRAVVVNQSGVLVVVPEGGLLCSYVAKYRLNLGDLTTGIGTPDLLFPGTGVVQASGDFNVTVNDFWQLDFYGTTATGLTIDGNPAHSFVSGRIVT